MTKAIATIAGVVAASALLTSCAEPLTDETLQPIEQQMEEAVPHAEAIEIYSGTAGEVTIVTASATVIYKNPEDFHAEDIGTLIEILNSNLGGLRYSEKSINLHFLTPETSPASNEPYTPWSGESFTRTVRDEEAWKILSDEMTLYTPASYNLRGRIQCALIDDVLYRVSSYDGAFDVEDYRTKSNLTCQQNIDNGNYITWEP